MDGFVAPRPRLALPRRSLHAATDEHLVAQIRGRDPAAARCAFELLYDRHHRGILAFCRHMLGSPEEAEDAVQHVFSAAYRALLRDERDVALRSWLYTIARNRCLSMLSARRDQIALDDVVGTLASTTGLALEVEQRSDLRALLADLQRLPEDQRAALVLAELEAHSHAEIAQILGVAPAKVKALVFQARETLMIRRQARETDCTAIREQLSVLRGGALRRRELRRHVEHCEGCRLFEAEVSRQRASMALLLPVAPTLALKNSSLAAAFSAGAAGAGAMAGGGGAIAAGGLAVGVKAISTKVLATLAVAGSAGGGGYVAVNEVAHPERKPAPAKATPAPASTAAAALRAAGVTPAATVVPGTVGARTSAATGEKRPADRIEPGRDRGRGRRPEPGGGPGLHPGPGPGPPPAGIAGAPVVEPAGGGRGRGSGVPRKQQPPREEPGKPAGGDPIRPVKRPRSPGGQGQVPAPVADASPVQRLPDRLKPQRPQQAPRPANPAPATLPKQPAQVAPAPERRASERRQRPAGTGSRRPGGG